jgi:hypothetical protein
VYQKITLSLFSFNVGGDFEALEKQAQNRALQRKILRDGSVLFIDKWISHETTLSYEKFFPKFLERYMMRILS